MELKGSKTEKNLLSAFAGEAMAAGRYAIYAEKAGNEGYLQIKDIFNETSRNETAHAKRILTFLNGVGSTEKNPESGIYGEHEEWAVIYKKMAETASDEGFTDIAVFLPMLPRRKKPMRSVIRLF